MSVAEPDPRELDEGEGLLSRAFADQRYDDRVDTEHEIDSREALSLIWRGMQLLRPLKGLLIAKALLMAAALLPTLMVPWVLKILIDNVVLGQPVGSAEVPYPPFMTWFLDFIHGMDQLEIMLTLSAWYLFMIVVIGHRAGAVGTGPGLYAAMGSDNTARAEVETSRGWSEAGGLLGYLEFLVTVRISQGVTNGLRTRLFRKMARLPLTTLDEQRIGDSIYRVLYDASSVPKLCLQLTVVMGFMVVSGVVNMYLIEYSYGEVAPEVVWIAWSLLPVTFLASIPLARILRRFNQNKRAAGSATTNAMEESVENIAALQSLGGMDRDRERIAERSQESFFRERLDIALLVTIFVAGGLALLAAVVYLMIAVTDQIIDGNMTPGDLVVMITVFVTLMFVSTGLGGVWFFVQDPVVALRRIFFYIDHESDDDHPGTEVIDGVRESVAFEGMGLTYPNGFEALRNIDLELRTGQLTALVGPTGAGKTTLAYLIPGFLQPSAGRITIDGQDSREIDLDSLRGQVTYVFQEHLLLSESVRDNLLLVKPEASDAELRDALEQAGAAEFVAELPDGIDTMLGSSGNTLSVGQQQRLCIARGLLRDTSVLVLDEPTAALDPTSENELVQSLKRIAEGRLVVVIAHRLSTIRHANRIVFLEGGEIQATGSHAELMQDAAGPYRRFVELQGG